MTTEKHPFCPPPITKWVSLQFPYAIRIFGCSPICTPPVAGVVGGEPMNHTGFTWASFQGTTVALPVFDLGDPPPGGMFNDILDAWSDTLRIGSSYIQVPANAEFAIWGMGSPKPVLLRMKRQGIHVELIYAFDPN